MTSCLGASITSTLTCFHQQQLVPAYSDFHLIRLDRGGDLDGSDAVDYCDHDVEQHFQFVVHHYFDVADLAVVDVLLTF